jgi:hypothetical protein
MRAMPFMIQDIFKTENQIAGFLDVAAPEHPFIEALDRLAQETLCMNSDHDHLMKQEQEQQEDQQMEEEDEEENREMSGSFPAEYKIQKKLSQINQLKADILNIKKDKLKKAMESILPKK